MISDSKILGIQCFHQWSVAKCPLFTMVRTRRQSWSLGMLTAHVSQLWWIWWFKIKEQRTTGQISINYFCGFFTPCLLILWCKEGQLTKLHFFGLFCYLFLCFMKLLHRLVWPGISAHFWKRKVELDRDAWMIEMNMSCLQSPWLRFVLHHPDLSKFLFKTVS